MKRPVGDRVCGDVQWQPLGRLHVHGVFLRLEQPGAVIQFHKPAVEVNRVIHQGVVHQGRRARSSKQNLMSSVSENFLPSKSHM